MSSQWLSLLSLLSSKDPRSPRGPQAPQIHRVHRTRFVSWSPRSQLCSNANTHSARLLLLQAAPDSTRSRNVESVCSQSHLSRTLTLVRYRFDCAADFSLLNLPKGKSLGRSKPATSSYAQALQHTMRDDSYYIQALLNCLLWNKMSTTNVSELGYLFHDKSSLHIIAWDLDVERSQSQWFLGWC